jgi:hypothetical protein
VTAEEAALQVRTMQLTRDDERRILAAGGLEAVEGGELGVEVEDVVEKRWWFGSISG